jgi:hypothetical protein
MHIAGTLTYLIPETFKLQATSLSVVSHSEDVIRFTFSLTNVGENLPPMNFNPSKITVQAMMEILFEEDGTVKSYGLGGNPMSYLAEYGIPQDRDSWQPGASFKKTAFNIKNPADPKMYDPLLFVLRGASWHPRVGWCVLKGWCVLSATPRFRVLALGETVLLGGPFTQIAPSLRHCTY